jgi:uncharacterized membrane protein YgcG
MRAAVAFLLTFLASFVSAQGYVINAFESEIDLKRDATFTVTERINVTFSEPRRGIFRTIPTAFETGRGTTRGTFLTDISAEMGDGSSVPTKVSRSGSEVEIRLGDKDVFLPSGTTKTYVIRYTVANAINWFEEGDWEPSAELYWNVNGTNWDTNINKLTALVRFPEVPDGRVRAKIFFGEYGSRASQLLSGITKITQGTETPTMATLDNDDFRVITTKPLQPGENVSVVVQIPQSLVPQPPLSVRARNFFLQNLGFLLPLVIGPFMLIALLKWGRDPFGGPMVVQFDPPDGISGPEAGTLIDQRVDLADISAGIISLAVKGYLRIHPEETGLIFKKRTAKLEMLGKPAGPELTTFESKLHGYLQKGGRTWVDNTDLRDDVAPHISDLRSTLYNSLQARGYYPHHLDQIRTGWIVGGLVLVVALGFLAMMLSPTNEIFPSVVGGIVSMIIVVVVAQFMPRRTKAGAEAFQKVRGFAEFIKRARGNEIDWMSKKQPDELLFESYLPHALAFGLAKEWAQAFEGVLHQMPSWYVTPYSGHYHSAWFGDDLMTVSSALGSAASTPPRSDGASGGSSGFSSGGGFSGGGFGGGGGGSW